MSKKPKSLGYFVDDLWARGFKLTDEEVQFIYFGKNYANANDWQVIFSLEFTLKIQHAFDGSFFLSVLELVTKNHLHTKKQAEELLVEKGFQLYTS